MDKSPRKLVTWKQWALAIPAVAVGACLSLYREYRDNGDVQGDSIAISAIVFCVGLGIVSFVFWYANRP